MPRRKPAVNCAYSLPTWLTLDHLAKTAQCITLDLPELSTCWIFLWSPDRRADSRIGDAASRRVRLAARAPGRRAKPEDPGSHHAPAFGRQPRCVAGRVVSGRAGILFLYRGPEHPIVLRSDEHYVDIGAYDGDTVKKFMLAARHEYASIHAFEPDPANYRLMRRLLEVSVSICITRRCPIPAAISHSQPTAPWEAGSR